MNTERLAQALNTIAMGFAEAAEAISTGAPVSAPRPAAGAVSPPAPAGTFSDGTPVDEAEQWEEFSAAPLPVAAEPTGPQGFDAVCPKHRTPYADGRYGPFCKSSTDDEAWGKRKPDGRLFCRITPKNAAQYLRLQAAA